MRKVYFFSKKEIIESWRTSRLLILIVIFLILGLMNPLLAKLTPEIIKMTIGEEVAKTIAKPTSLDSWTQFFKNFTQIGLIVLALMFSGIVSNEVSKGTLINLVTKGLQRWIVIVSKLISLIIQWTICFLLSFLVTWFYSLYYFPDNDSPYIFHAVFPLWIFGILLVSLFVFSSTVARNNYEGLLLTGGGAIILVLVNLFDNLKYYNPISLITQNISFLQDAQLFQDFLPAVFISIILFLIFTGSSIVIFNKKKL